MNQIVSNFLYGLTGVTFGTLSIVILAWADQNRDRATFRNMATQSFVYFVLTIICFCNIK